MTRKTQCHSVSALTEKRRIEDHDLNRWGDWILRPAGLIALSSLDLGRRCILTIQGNRSHRGAFRCTATVSNRPLQSKYSIGHKQGSLCPPSSCVVDTQRTLWKRTVPVEEHSYSRRRKAFDHRNQNPWEGWKAGRVGLHSQQVDNATRGQQTKKQTSGRPECGDDR